MKSKNPIAKVRPDAKRGLTFEEAKAKLAESFARQLGCKSIEEVDAIVAENLRKSKK